MGKKVSIENDVYNSYLNNNFIREEWDLNVIKGMSIVIQLNETEHLGIVLCRLTEGKRFVTTVFDIEYNSDAVDFWRTVTPEDSYTYDIFYTPKKDKPFKVEITDLTYYDIGSNFVRLSARVDGVLYRETNPQQDSVVIKGYFEVL